MPINMIAINIKTRFLHISRKKRPQKISKVERSLAGPSSEKLIPSRRNSRVAPCEHQTTEGGRAQSWR